MRRVSRDWQNRISLPSHRTVYGTIHTKKPMKITLRTRCLFADWPPPSSVKSRETHELADSRFFQFQFQSTPNLSTNAQPESAAYSLSGRCQSNFCLILFQFSGSRIVNFLSFFRFDRSLLKPISVHWTKPDPRKKKYNGKTFTEYSFYYFRNITGKRARDSYLPVYSSLRIWARARCIQVCVCVCVCDVLCSSNGNPIDFDRREQSNEQIFEFGPHSELRRLCPARPFTCTGHRAKKQITHTRTHELFWKCGRQWPTTSRTTTTITTKVKTW